MSLVIAALINIGIIYALVTGLASTAMKLVVQNIDVAVIKEPPPDESKPPPPPPPQMKEPPPFVPPPDINIDMTEAAPANNAIQTTTTQVPTAPPAPAPVTSAPKPINSHAVTERDYPPISIRLNEEGKVGVRYVVSAEGNVTDVNITSSSGKERLDQAAVGMVKRWRFHPALQAGKPVAATLDAVVVFRLH
jgi:protein TonB